MRRIAFLMFAVLGFIYGSSLIGPEESVRGPAALSPIAPQETDVASDLKEKIIREILNSTTTERRAVGVALRFGPVGQCDGFNQVEVVLMGEGVATSGEPAQLRIVSPCSEWTLVPFEKIYGANPANGIINLESSELSIEATNISDDWPTEWYVGSVTLVSGDGEKNNITVEATDFRKAKGRSVAVYW